MAKSENELYQNFKQFVTERWEEDHVHAQGDFTPLFSIDSRHCRYHLVKMVEEGLLCSVSYKNRVYYVKPQNAQIFRQFKHIGVKVKCYGHHRSD